MLGRVKTRHDNGDTIVEVMIAVVVAGLALAIAYQLSNASLRTSTQSSQRSQALQVASAQIERLKSVYYSDKDPNHSAMSTFQQTTNDFCVNSDNSVTTIPIGGTCVTDDLLNSNSIFSLDDHYDGTTYSFKATWTNINGHGQDSLTLYYRFP